MTAPEILLFVGLVVMALVMIIGAKRRWRWLADPPAFLWPIYPYAFVKRFFGRQTLTWFLYISGVTLLLILSYVFVLLYL
jgi:hypothetical protein